MNYPSTIVSHNFSTPEPCPDDSDASAKTADPASTAETAAPAAKRGRPSGYAPRVVDMLCASIRTYGLSDSAAAQQQGMSTTTISRWKQKYPEVALKLQQARQEIRTHHLDKILRHAEAENMRGLRASIWILERLFPQDYAPRMEERFAHRNFEDQQRAREESALTKEDILELQAIHAAKRADEANAPSAGVSTKTAAESLGAADTADDSSPEKVAPHSESASRYSHNSDAGDSASDTDPLAEPAAVAHVPSEEASRNSRNSADAEPPTGAVACEKLERSRPLLSNAEGSPSTAPEGEDAQHSEDEPQVGDAGRRHPAPSNNLHAPVE